MSDLLTLDRVRAGFGEAVILEDVCISVASGQSLAVLGRNGVGKTTLLETIMGNTRVTRGAITFNGCCMTRWPSHARVRAGLGWVPQEREVFPSLTVTENLTVVSRPGPWNVQRVYALFPRLRERSGNYGNQLSGGEQQMLAIGRALMTNPKLILLDEPMEGLAPIIVAELAVALKRMCEQEGTPSIIVEQRPIIALAMSQRAVVLERGAVVYQGDSAELAANRVLLSQLLGVGGRKSSAKLSIMSARHEDSCLSAPLSGVLS